jgi:hypothetical protein
MRSGDDGAVGRQAGREIHRVTALIAFAAIVFSLFFQVNKGGPFRGINPFAEDPYDAVGSLAVQGALLIVLLTYARALRLRVDAGQAAKGRLILRGNGLVLLAVWATLVADAVAVIVHPIAPSGWGLVLLAGLGLMFLFASICTGVLAIAAGRVQSPPVPRDLTLADAIDDLWALVRVPVTRLRAVLPRPLVEWVDGFTSDRLFARAQWLNPRRHPWRFACVLGLVVGVGLVLAQLQEGLPPNLQTGLLVAGIFVSVELAATLLGLAVLGGYLGLRPSP